MAHSYFVMGFLTTHDLFGFVDLRLGGNESLGLSLESADVLGSVPITDRVATETYFDLIGPKKVDRDTAVE